MNKQKLQFVTSKKKKNELDRNLNAVFPRASRVKNVRSGDQFWPRNSPLKQDDNNVGGWMQKQQMKTAQLYNY